MSKISELHNTLAAKAVHEILGPMMKEPGCSLGDIMVLAESITFGAIQIIQKRHGVQRGADSESALNLMMEGVRERLRQADEADAATRQ